jgi:hypothetical protein
VEAYITVTTRLLHVSGEWIESDLSIPAVQRDRFDAQSCGSALTYACRYALQSICCVPREDDDGNAATGRRTQEEAQATAQTKIAELKAKKAQKTAPSTSNGQPVLFYCWPENHNNMKAEFFTRAYGSNFDNSVVLEGLQAVFKRFGAKATAEGTALVEADKIQGLLEVLAGEVGISVQEAPKP